MLADGHRGPADYLKAIFTTNQTIESLWRKAPNANGNVTSFAGTRSVGATGFMDPDKPTSGFYRSLIGDRDLTTKEITGGFAVPGRAAPKADGAPIYDEIPTVTDAAAPIEPAAVLPPDTRLKLLEKVAGSGDTAVFRVQGLDDAAIAGYVVARDLEPRDSIAALSREADRGQRQGLQHQGDRRSPRRLGHPQRDGGMERGGQARRRDRRDRVGRRGRRSRSTSLAPMPPTARTPTRSRRPMAGPTARRRRPAPSPSIPSPRSSAP